MKQHTSTSLPKSVQHTLTMAHPVMDFDGQNLLGGDVSTNNVLYSETAGTTQTYNAAAVISDESFE